MLSQLLGSFQISEERIEEIFEVPKTKERWEKLVENIKFRRMMVDSVDEIQRIIGYTSTKDQIVKTNLWESKVTIIQYGLFFVANEGVSLNKGIQKSCDFILKEIDSISEEEIDDILQEFLQILFEERMYSQQKDSSIVYADTLM